MNIVKPMLACSTIPKEHEIKFPKLVSTKFDGIRCLIKNGNAYSRNDKLIPNRYIQSVLRELSPYLINMDGELLVRGAKDFNEVDSAVMSQGSRPDFCYHCFDNFAYPADSFSNRLRRVSRNLAVVPEVFRNRVSYVSHDLITNYKDLVRAFEFSLYKGYEGLILRDPFAPYKYGRSTLKQNWMLKMKAVLDMEGTIVGFNELMRNEDTDTKRQENMVPDNSLGSFIVDFGGPSTVDVGSGFTMQQRIQYWRDGNTLLGKRITFKYQEMSKYGIPRFPVFKGFRNDL